MTEPKHLIGYLIIVEAVLAAIACAFVGAEVVLVLMAGVVDIPMLGQLSLSTGLALSSF